MSNYWEQTDQGWFSGQQTGQDFQQDYGYSMGSDQSGYYSSQQSTNSNYNYGGQMFMPSQQMPPNNGSAGAFEDEPPLLEELGINFEHIRQKTLAVLNPLQTASAEVIADQDLAGPLVFCLLFGGSLLLHGKVHFGYIYGIGALGCLAMYALLNLMANSPISVTCTASVLGYCLLPMALLSLLAVGLSFKGVLGLGVSGMAVLWCSVSASKLFVTALAMDHQRLLIAYPCTLLYGLFALLAIF